MEPSLYFRNVKPLLRRSSLASLMSFCNSCSASGQSRIVAARNRIMFSEWICKTRHRNQSPHPYTSCDPTPLTPKNATRMIGNNFISLSYPSSAGTTTIPVTTGIHTARNTINPAIHCINLVILALEHLWIRNLNWDSNGHADKIKFVNNGRGKVTQESNSGTVKVIRNLDQHTTQFPNKTHHHGQCCGPINQQVAG